MQQEQRPGRRTVLGAAAALGAGAVVLGGGITPAAAAEPSARRGGHGGSYQDLPVPTVIGHRGCSGSRPEHTLGSYQFALDNGADVIEQDLVPTKDGHLVCRHENDITGTTDVASRPEFASRKTTKTVDGEAHTGWFTEDFTLAELKTLRAKERIPGTRQHNTLYDGRWQVPTFEEVLKWAEEQGRKRGRRIWLHVETKHPTYFRKAGLGLEERLAKLLRRYGRAGRDGHTFLQSFEPSSLQRLGKLGIDCPKVLLLDDLPTRPWDFTEAKDPRTVADLITPKGLKWVSGFAQGIGPWLNLVIPRDKDDRLTKPTTLVRDAHAAGLILHPYTMRNENSFLPADFRRGTDPNAYGDVFAAFRTYFATGIDGIFTDNPDTGALARADFVKG
ncbi:glycerophosphodiester phosphodiesterase [Streptomyces triculaminicus]|uniref:glycerophosphodiester phosphodiesterase n=2 Tax=Streptomyces TaxID=1883 RepID=A0A939JRB5_9ACTN|nr:MULTISPECIES: glycerophosphodiester phosphodiesterase [Streptomyces]MBO0653444.1 glycerophosphodiester phosphodiesterase [Streptomyces triculaminicus]QSY48306.1 glycerophosphodiester phosphodiesterase [Streptomyces griseocarneus]